MAGFLHRHVLPPFRRPPLPFFRSGGGGRGGATASGPSAAGAPASASAAAAAPARRRPWTPRRILDPGDDVVLRWNRLFLVTCMVGLFVDPMYFYLLHTGLKSCVTMDMQIGVGVTAVRTVADLFYLAHMILKFRTAFVAPSSRVFGRGELVRDPDQIAIRYLKNDFIIDLAAMLPIPQVIIWFVIPAVNNSSANHTNNTLSMIVLIQYIPRVFLIVSLNSKIVKSSGVVTRTAWAGAAYNLLLYTLASHVLGALWYLLSIERQYTCWMDVCTRENGTNPAIPKCYMSYLDCKTLEDPIRMDWHSRSEIDHQCLLPEATYVYGLFADALNLDVAKVNFWDKYLYCLWWGFRNLSSYGQNLENSTYRGETIFCILICIMGLVFFSHLIGNMQTYLQSMTVRLEEWRVKRRDIEEWMRHRQLPLELQERVRRFFQYKWLATRGVDEESILQSLPLDLRREIQRHLCLALVRRVPFFSQMDEQLLDAICERLVSSLSTKDAYIVREGDPVSEMLFVIRGELESSTTDGGRTNFFSSITLRPGDFCGEELLTWALMPNPSLNFPQSTRTVRSVTEVEAFALRAEDLKYVANQFKRLHSKRLQHAFRYYSHQWRSWGACFVQGAWRRYKKRKLARELSKQEELYYMQGQGGDDGDGHDDSDSAPLLGAGAGAGGDHRDGAAAGAAHLGATFLASKFAKNTKKSAAAHHGKARMEDVSSIKFPKLAKPDEPDFSLSSDDVL
ncbi:cyclic nucleotide-gated ion channel 18 [Oryza glaberrima]|nr:cyclic nucleotide-gated ion channel 18 [Oryza glaberrima]